MRLPIRRAAILMPLLALPAFAAGEHHAPAGAVTLADSSAVRWQPGPANLPKGTQISPLAGDPAKPGPFVLRIRFPANTVIAPHTHSKDETLTILSGSIYHQHGRTLDKSKGEPLRAGGFVYLPEAMPHALWTTDEDVVLQVNGSGPFGVDYLDPADDPSRAGR
ncbi:cupin domain-containing protein [Methylobacterium sp. Leaf118]|uniref:cupin domain-containing protein n=1 Tax=Methylobacterium sp. Leaf118 TaxID=2876562 RepID=UPI001E446AD7|nr:cupin domain-containing protein [Methylobacterium sp. Leaf118]